MSMAFYQVILSGHLFGQSSYNLVTTKLQPNRLPLLQLGHYSFDSTSQTAQ